MDKDRNPHGHPKKGKKRLLKVLFHDKNLEETKSIKNLTQHIKYYV